MLSTNEIKQVCPCETERARSEQDLIYRLREWNEFWRRKNEESKEMKNETV